MLLETLDIKENDILIYSQNLFDPGENFKIVYKDDARKEHRKITVSEVYSFVNEYTPKNLIVYRILTNIKNFDIHPPKYGFFISVHNINELIYFDPIFAIKEIEEYGLSEEFSDLRFRIQQVGLTTLNRTGNIANFAEIYSIDLQAKEAKFQNDKIIADAVLSHLKKEKKGIKPLSQAKPDLPHKKNIKSISHNVSEDKDYDAKKIIGINYKGSAGVRNISGITEEPPHNDNMISEKEDLILGEVENPKSDFSKFIQKKKKGSGINQNDTPAEESKNDKVLNIFKSPESLNKFLEERKQKPVILKLDKK